MYQRKIIRTEPSEFFRAVLLVIFILGMLATPVAAFERYTAHGGPVRDLTLSPDGRTLVSASLSLIHI